jgi:hypothetical protein
MGLSGSIMSNLPLQNPPMFFQVPVNAVVLAVGKAVDPDEIGLKVSAGGDVLFTEALVNRRLLPAMVPFDATPLVVVFQAIVILPTSWCAAPAVAPKT